MLVRAGIVGVEYFVYSPQNNVKRDAGVLPAFNQGPVEGRDEHVLAASAHKLIFDLGEIIEIVQLVGWTGAVVRGGAFQGSGSRRLVKKDVGQLSDDKKSDRSESEIEKIQTDQRPGFFCAFCVEFLDELLRVLCHSSILLMNLK